MQVRWYSKYNRNILEVYSLWPTSHIMVTQNFPLFLFYVNRQQICKTVHLE